MEIVYFGFVSYIVEIAHFGFVSYNYSGNIAFLISFFLHSRTSVFWVCFYIVQIVHLNIFLYKEQL